VSGVDLVQWYGAQLDEDERIARAAIRAVGDVPGGVPGAAHWRFGNAYTDEGGTYWQITTMPPDAEVFGPVELIGSGMSGGGAHEPEIARHAVEHDPARVLREIEAKRAIVARYEFACREAADDRSNSEEEREVWVKVAGALQSVVIQLAAPYSDRLGYEEAMAS
jgi:hypothetical protein